jgi:hypothetical protein
MKQSKNKDATIYIAFSVTFIKMNKFKTRHQSIQRKYIFPERVQDQTELNWLSTSVFKGY